MVIQLSSNYKINRNPLRLANLWTQVSAPPCCVPSTYYSAGSALCILEMLSLKGEGILDLVTSLREINYVSKSSVNEEV